MTHLLILVPARGGSKRLPGKNVACLAGKSLLAWTAEVVRNSRAKGAPCILSTDDDKIRQEGLRLRWAAPWLRPANLATDAASTFDVAIHALDWWQSDTGSDPELLLLLQPTSPFRKPSSIDSALELIEDQGVEAVVGTTELHRSPSTLFSMNEYGYLQPLGQKKTPNPVFTPNGALYLIRCSALREQRTFFPKQLRALQMSERESVDIDTCFDWQVASALAGNLLNVEI